ncbi:hypothetical protein [Algibacter mikhailovii]|uniref:hypothetical protein n=1 Tax=Algibacter mikhailovii TaxID=425498 RepID=UPI0024956794|nr:hypothetical protein [Algibacter mikhailovii]
MMNNQVKKIISILTIFVSTSMSCFGQNSDSEINLIQEIFGLEKTEMLSELLGDVNDEFWSTYKEYEEKRMALGKERLALIRSYSEAYDSLTDEKIDQLLKDIQTQSKNTENLINQYTKKIKKVSGSKVAAQFYQLETYLLAAVRVKIMEITPIIGELDPQY